MQPYLLLVVFGKSCASTNRFLCFIIDPINKPCIMFPPNICLIAQCRKIFAYIIKVFSFICFFELCDLVLGVLQQLDEYFFWIDCFFHIVLSILN